MASRGQGLTVKPLGPLAAAIGRLYAAPPNSIPGVETSDWFGPLQPVSPIAPAGTQPRGPQYLPGQNLIYTPREDMLYTADQLRGLATYFLARVCIENIKDVVCDLPKQIVLKPKPGESGKDTAKRGQGDPMLAKLNAFFDAPNFDEDWPAFLRPLLEDMLVADCGSVLLRAKPKTGEIYDVRAIRGDIIVRYIDEQGFTPMPPAPAYAQLWYGIPMVNLTTDQLIYKPRNIVIRAGQTASQLYGMSPTEQGAEEITIGKLRMNFVRDYYTDGVIPDLLQVAPADTSADKILEQMQDFNSAMAGMLAKRRGLRTIQGFTEDGKDQIFFPKEKMLSDPFDDLHVRKICFVYGVSPQRLLKQMNRASAEQSDDAAQDEGTAGWVSWVKGVCNGILRRLGAIGYEMSFDMSREPDIVKLSGAQKTWVGIGIKTIDEVREANGDDPIGAPETSKPFVLTASGPVPLVVEDQIEQTQKKQAAGVAPDPNAKPSSEGDEEDDEHAPPSPAAKARKKKLRILKLNRTY